MASDTLAWFRERPLASAIVVSLAIHALALTLFPQLRTLKTEPPLPLHVDILPPSREEVRAPMARCRAATAGQISDPVRTGSPASEDRPAAAGDLGATGSPCRRAPSPGTTGSPDRESRGAVTDVPVLRAGRARSIGACAWGAGRGTRAPPIRICSPAMGTPCPRPSAGISAIRGSRRCAAGRARPRWRSSSAPDTVSLRHRASVERARSAGRAGAGDGEGRAPVAAAARESAQARLHGARARRLPPQRPS